MKTGIAVSVFALASLLASTSFAQARFGDEGQLVIQDDAKVQVGGTTQGSQTNAFIALLPAADFFVVREVSLGAQVGYGDNGGAQFLEVAPRVGYNVTITNDLSFWIKGYIGYIHTWANNGPSTDQIFLQAFAPLLWHPATHFFFGGGPYVQPAFVINQPTAVTFGVMSTVGGWFVP
jgi:hypothetical protein